MLCNVICFTKNESGASFVFVDTLACFDDIYREQHYCEIVIFHWAVTCVVKTNVKERNCSI